MQEFHFPNWVNKFTLVVLGSVLVVGGYLATCLFAATHPQIVNVGHAPKQPVPFSHRIHAGKLKLDCRYCHNTVHESAHAAVPPTATCGNCHGANRVIEGQTLGVVKPESELLAPIRESLESSDFGKQPGMPVEWIRVHDLPDFVYFNHSVHINRGVSCYTCHDRIDQMEVVTQKRTLSMKWCLDCHRDPAGIDPATKKSRIRDPELVTQLDFEPVDGDWAKYGKEWAEKLKINPNTSCSTCHR